MQEHKRHVKMYKAGKTWCMAAVTVAVVAVAGMTTVQADDSSQGANNNTVNTSVAVQAQNENQGTDNQSNKDELTATQSDKAQSSDTQSNDNQTNNNQQSQVEQSNTTQVAETSNVETKTANNSVVSDADEQNDFASHNHIVSTDASSVDNVDGYVTADAWYQPKDILKNGQNWEASTSNDRRPILMAWWPDKATQAAYVNFMVDNHIVDGDHVDANVDQSNLNSRSQAIQVAIEQRISNENSTDWLKPLFSQFKSSQPDWNRTSENPNGDGFQGGFIGYENSDKTPNANSDYREMNRTPTRQDGTQKYSGNPADIGGSEFLLANDVDNSNPAVQAEQLNWLHYLMNLGSITANDSDANFDSYRFDAVDDVDADLLNIASDYMKAHFGIDQSERNANNHFSILEDWNKDDFKYVNDQGNSQLSMDQTVLHNLVNGLQNKPNQRENLDNFYKDTFIDRQNDNTENVAEPNYSFAAAHDSDIQWMINDILKDLYPGTETLKATREQFDKAFEVYNKDRAQADKKYAKYNVPSAYALLLTNKDTIPRVYYGDLYVDNAQYMSEKSPYYDTITQLMKDRVKYVSGGQAIQSDTQNVKTGSTESRAWDMLTSVRYGKGLMNASDVDSSNNSQRTDGIGTIVSNNQNFALADGEEVVLHMGASHKNQMFRASVLTTRDGLKVYSSDNGAPTMQTDENGDLHFDNSWVYGVTDPQVSGYLAVWVPCGASANQDVRSFDQLSDEANSDGRTTHSNAATDSNLIFEGFSNFQPMPTTADEATNAQIAKNAGLFKELGITSFEFAPQYRSADDNSFIDSTIKNGYAFTDRYDLGFDNADGTPNPTKYGTIEQLRQAIKAVHSQGIQAMADFVPNQIYSLPKQEAVTASKVNSFGQPIAGSELLHGVYIANSMSSGSDFQSVYGGKYLKELQEKYPQLFTRAQISNGKTLPTDEPITQWKAKYLNGTNIQGKGAFYALMEKSSGKYLNVSNGSLFFLPDSLYSAKDAAAAKKAADEAAAKKAADEAAAKKAADEAAAKKAADEAAAKKAADEAAKHAGWNGYLYDDEVNGWRWFEDGQLYTGFRYYAGTYYWFQDGARQDNAFHEEWGKTYYTGADGRAVQGIQNINGQELDFGNDGTYYLRSTGYLWDGSAENGGYRWYEDGQLYTGFRYYAGTYYWFIDGVRQNAGWREAWGYTYYTDNDGRAVQGTRFIDGKLYNFGDDNTFYERPLTGYLWDGSSQNGGYRWYENGELFTGFRFYTGTYYWFIDGVRQNAGWREAWGYKYYTDGDGRAVQGWQNIDGVNYYFGDDNTYYLR